MVESLVQAYRDGEVVPTDEGLMIRDSVFERVSSRDVAGVVRWTQSERQAADRACVVVWEEY